MKKSVKIELNNILKHYKHKNIDDIKWFHITLYDNLSEGFIEEFQDKMDWHLISKHQKLSENFMRKFQDKLDWNPIVIDQKLSDDFIREFQNKLGLDYMLEWNIITQKFYNELKYGKPKLRYEILDFS